MAADRIPLKRWTSAEGVLIVFILCVCSYQGVSGNCTLPADLRGTWEDSLKGSLTFTEDGITGYSIYLFGDFNLTCYYNDGDTYIMESNSFSFFGLTFNGYFCWSITKVTSSLYYFYEYNSVLTSAGSEKVRMYIPITTRNISEICDNPSPGLGTYRVLYVNQSLSSSISTCPSVLQGYFTYSITVGGSNVCTGDISLDVCSSTSYLRSSNQNGNCTTPLGYSAGGELGCLISVQSGSMTYVTVANTDSSVDGASTYRTTCLIIDSSTSPYQATQYPKQCPDDMNATYVASPGGAISLTLTESCPTSTDSLLWLVAVVVVLLLLIVGGMLCACYFYRRRKRQQEEEEERKKLEEEERRRLEEEEEEERARAALEEGRQHTDRDGKDGDDDDKDGSSLGHGEFPPDVTIDIDPPPSPPPSPKGVFRKHLEDLEDKPGFRSSGDITPSGIHPTYDNPHKRFSKRRRVWMIGKDGKAVKVWKEGDEDLDDKDSGMEDEDENGDKVDGKDGNKFGGRYSGLSGKDKAEKDFFKQYGRQNVKGSKELTSKGDLKKTSSKLHKTVKKMAVVKSFSKPLKERQKSRSRSRDKSYKQSSRMTASTDFATDSFYDTDYNDDNGGSRDDDTDDMVVEEEEELEEEEEEEEEGGDRDRDGERDGDQSSGDQPGSSSDSSKDRDSALSSSPSSSSASSDNIRGGISDSAREKEAKKQEGDQRDGSGRDQDSSEEEGRQSRGRDKKDQSGKLGQSGSASSGDGKDRTDSTGRKSGSGGESSASGSAGSEGKTDTGKEGRVQSKDGETDKPESGKRRGLFGWISKKQTESDKDKDKSGDRAGQEGQAAEGREGEEDRDDQQGKGAGAKQKQGLLGKAKSDTEGQGLAGTGAGETDSQQKGQAGKGKGKGKTEGKLGLFGKGKGETGSLETGETDGTGQFGKGKGKADGKTDDKQGSFGKGKGETDDKQGSFGKGKGETDGKQGSFGKGKSETDGKQGSFGKGKGETDGKQGSFGKGKGETDGKQGSFGKGKGETDGKLGIFGKGKGEKDGKQLSFGKGKGETDDKQLSFGKGKGETEGKQGLFGKGKGETDGKQGLFGKGKGETDGKLGLFGKGKGETDGKLGLFGKGHGKKDGKQGQAGKGRDKSGGKGEEEDRRPGKKTGGDEEKKGTGRSGTGPGISGGGGSHGGRQGEGDGMTSRGGGGRDVKKGGAGREDGAKRRAGGRGGGGGADDDLDALDSTDLQDPSSRAGPNRSSSRAGGKGKNGKGTAWVGGGGRESSKESRTDKSSSGSSGSTSRPSWTTGTSTDGPSTQMSSRTSMGTTVSFLPSSETSLRDGTRSSKRSGKLSSLASTRDDVTLPSMSSGFISHADTPAFWRDSASASRPNSLMADRAGRAGGQVSGSDREVTDHSRLPALRVSPRPGDSKEGKRQQAGKDQPERGGQRASTRSMRSSNLSSQDRGDSTLTTIDIGDPFSQLPSMNLESSRPPTNHRRRQGWREEDSARSRSPPGTREEGPKGRVDRSQSDRAAESRSVRWQSGDEDASMAGTATDSRRSVRWKKDQGTPPSVDSRAFPLTSREGTRQSTRSSNTYTPSRQNWVYSSMSELVRIHRKKKAVAPSVDSESPGDSWRRRLRRPSDMDDLNWRRLLEELYPDKKYLDYAKATSREKEEDAEEEYLFEKAGQGLKYLYGRAKFWEKQEPLVRPGTTLTVHSFNSNSSSSSNPSQSTPGTPGPKDNKRS